MKKNMGTTDKAIRILIAIIITVFYFAHVISGTLAFVGLSLSGILILTSFAGVCPIYMPFGIASNNQNKK